MGGSRSRQGKGQRLKGKVRRPSALRARLARRAAGIFERRSRFLVYETALGGGEILTPGFLFAGREIIHKLLSP